MVKLISDSLQGSKYVTEVKTLVQIMTFQSINKTVSMCLRKVSSSNRLCVGTVIVLFAFTSVFILVVSAFTFPLVTTVETASHPLDELVNSPGSPPSPSQPELLHQPSPSPEPVPHHSSKLPQTSPRLSPSPSPSPPRQPSPNINSESLEVCRKGVVHPNSLIHDTHFDSVFKYLYIYFYHQSQLDPSFIIPGFIRDSYLEHVRSYTAGFSEGSYKRSPEDFIGEFHKLYHSIKTKSLDLNSKCPVRVDPLPKDPDALRSYNGHHRQAVAQVLKKDKIGINCKYPDKMFTEKHRKKSHIGWEWYQNKGINQKMIELAAYWFVSGVENFRVLTFFPSFVDSLRKAQIDTSQLIKMTEKFSGRLMYLKELELTHNGLEMLLDLTNSELNGEKTETQSLMMLFVYFNDPDDGQELLNHVIKESKISETDANLIGHVADSHDQSILLSQHFLFPESVKFLNFADSNQRKRCKELANTLKTELNVDSSSLLPQNLILNYPHTLDLFGLKPLSRNELQLVYNKKVSGNEFVSKSDLIVHKNDHDKEFQSLLTNVETLLFDPNYHGFCYGVKFISLKHVLHILNNKKDKNFGQVYEKLLGSELGNVLWL
ncbi:hypothetical protein P9112_001560 [Eukaryota sp. TZLM1-RC]